METNIATKNIFFRYNISYALGLLLLAGAGTQTGCQPKARSFVYVLTNPDGNNAIEAFRRDADTGQLARIGRYSTGGTGDPLVAGYQQQAVVTDGRTVFAVNPGSNTVSAMAIQDDGSLVLLNQVPTGGMRPASLTLRRGLLYVANTGHAPIEAYAAASYKGFVVQSNGALGELACPVLPATDGPVGASISSLVLNEDASVLIATGLLPNLLETFRVDSSGCLANRLTFAGGGGPYGSNFNNGQPGRYFVTLGRPEDFAGEQAPGVASYQVGPDNMLTRVGFYTDPDTSNDGLRDPCWVVPTLDGTRFWTSSFIPRALTLFEVTSAGQLTRVSTYKPSDSVPNPTPGGPPVVVGSTDIALSSDGRFFYQLRVLSSPDADIPVPVTLVAYTVTSNWSTDAGLREIQRLPLPDDLNAAGVTGLALAERN